jgi:DUF2889 family protein
MPLPSSTPRALQHTRSLRFEGYFREDGLWDIEAHLVDTKPMDMPLSSGIRKAGEAVHEMWIRLTIDRKMNVIDAMAVTDAMPYTGLCDRITPDYAKLKGLNLMQGFRHAIKQLYGDIKGCTHLNEILGQMPSAAIQSFASRRRDNIDDGRQPFQLDRCHALATDSEAVMRYYPKWYRAREADAAGTDGAA